MKVGGGLFVKKKKSHGAVSQSHQDYPQRNREEKYVKEQPAAKGDEVLGYSEERRPALKRQDSYQPSISST